jgi:C_GCAxxG_C_C family probable redox protein
MNAAETALALFKEGGGFNCAQAVLAAIAPRFNLDRETACKVAGAFGGGIGRSGAACGAVTGALMAIGLRYGMTEIEDQDGKIKTYERAGEFLARFKGKHGVLNCKELLGVDISTPEGLKQIKERKMGATHCTGFIRDAVAILEEII